MVTESDAASAVFATLADAGFAIEHPPEDRLFKARTGDTVVDILHRLNGVPVDTATLDCAEQFDVLAIAVPAPPPTMVLTQKLRSLGEHHCDSAKLLPPVRAVRERVDWDRIRAERPQRVRRRTLTGHPWPPARPLISPTGSSSRESTPIASNFSANSSRSFIVVDDKDFCRTRHPAE